MDPQGLNAFEPVLGGTPIALSGLQAPDLQMLELLLNRMPDSVVMLDKAHRFVFANAAALSKLGVSAAQLLGRHAAEVLGDAIYSGYIVPLETEVWAGKAMRWEGWRDTPRMGRRYLEELLIPYAPGGVVSACLLMDRDLTDSRINAERDLALERAEQLKAAIMDNALTAIVSSDAHGVIVEFNPAAQAMFGLSREQAVGRTVAEVMVPERHRAGHIAGMNRIASGGAPRLMGQPLSMHATRADGTEFPMQMVLWKSDVAGERYYTASISDMSEQVRAAEVIERQREALRQSEKLSAMGGLLAGVAHELNNPLAIVMGRASLLEDKTVGTPLEKDAQRIFEAAERCGRIVRTFLNMARQRPAQRNEVQLNELVIGAGELLQYSLRASSVVLTLNLADDLPQLHADGDRLGQVVLNLIVNAQQALNTCSGRREVRVSTGIDIREVGGATADAEPTMWLRVSDNGPGVPEAVRDRIFDPYFTTKGEGMGTGLGLAVSRSVARDHGGDLLLESTSSGASFVLQLPVKPRGGDLAPPSDEGAVSTY